MKWEEIVLSKEFLCKTAIGKFTIRYYSDTHQYEIEYPQIPAHIAPARGYKSLEDAMAAVDDIIRKTAAALLKDLGEV